MDSVVIHGSLHQREVLSLWLPGKDLLFIIIITIIVLVALILSLLLLLLLLLLLENEGAMNLDDESGFYSKPSNYNNISHLFQWERKRFQSQKGRL